MPWKTGRKIIEDLNFIAVSLMGESSKIDSELKLKLSNVNNLKY